MRLVIRRWQRFAVVLLALAAFPATPAERVFSPRLPGGGGPGGPGGIAPGVSDNAVLPVTMEVVQACLVSASDLDFGAYASNQTTPVRGQTVIQLTCGPGTNAEILLDAGTGSNRNTSRRHMGQDSGTDRMDYDLFQDPGRTSPLGRQVRQRYARGGDDGRGDDRARLRSIPPRQHVRDGTYNDMITVTVHY